VYFGLSGTLMASIGLGIFTEEVFHLKKRHENKGETRVCVRDKIGPTDEGESQ
jgi:hypothetical protein